MRENFPKSYFEQKEELWGLVSSIDTNLVKKNRKLSSKEIAKFLWLNPNAILSDGMIKKVHDVAAYLKLHNLEFISNKDDGDSFLNAFLKSLETLSRTIPILDAQADKISYLRGIIASAFTYTKKGDENPSRSEKIKAPGEHILAAGEGDLLALNLNIPMRMITVKEDQGISKIIDTLIFPEKNKKPQQWGTIKAWEKPREHILIVDLGGHFVSAEPKMKKSNERNKKDHGFLIPQITTLSMIKKNVPLYKDEVSKVLKTLSKEDLENVFDSLAKLFNSSNIKNKLFYDFICLPEKHNNLLNELESSLGNGLESVKEVLNKGAVPNERIIEMTVYNKFEGGILDILLEKGPVPSATALNIAFDRKCENRTIMTLLEAGAVPTHSTLVLAIIRKYDSKIISALIKAGSDSSDFEDRHENRLNIDVKIDDEETVKVLKEAFSI